MREDEQKEALREIIGKYADRTSLVDDMGLPLGKDKLLTLAQTTPIWSALTDSQKQQFFEENGTFASGRSYVASARTLRKPKNLRQKVQTSSGKIIYI
jgi:hypothetical protein